MAIGRVRGVHQARAHVRRGPDGAVREDDLLDADLVPDVRLVLDDQARAVRRAGRALRDRHDDVGPVAQERHLRLGHALEHEAVPRSVERRLADARVAVAVAPGVDVVGVEADQPRLGLVARGVDDGGSQIRGEPDRPVGEGDLVDAGAIGVLEAVAQDDAAAVAGAGGALGDGEHDMVARAPDRDILGPEALEHEPVAAVEGGLPDDEVAVPARPDVGVVAGPAVDEDVVRLDCEGLGRARSDDPRDRVGDGPPPHLAPGPHGPVVEADLLDVVRERIEGVEDGDAIVRPCEPQLDVRPLVRGAEDGDLARRVAGDA